MKDAGYGSVLLISQSTQRYTSSLARISEFRMHFGQDGSQFADKLSAHSGVQHVNKIMRYSRK